MTLSARDEAMPEQDIYVLPVSLTQEGLWFLDQLEPQSVTYNMLVILRIRKPLEVKTLERSINALVQRHEVLRTTFQMSEEEPVQIIASQLALPLPEVDLRDVSENERELEAQRLAGEEAQRPFDLTRGPLLRAMLLRLVEEDAVLVLTVHHIVFDGWSVDVFLRELISLYQAFVAGQPSPLPDLPLQYADFAVWQRSLLRDGYLAKQQAYWERQLATRPESLELPTDHPRSPQVSMQGATYTLSLPQALVEQLKHVSRQQGVTLYMTLVAAFQTLLYRYTG